jgi:hypothetical protein
MPPHCLSRTSTSAMDGTSPLQEKASHYRFKSFLTWYADELINHTSFPKQLEEKVLMGLMKDDNRFTDLLQGKDYYYSED